MDLTALTRLADPTKAAEAAAAGLPTINVDSFKSSLTASMEIKNKMSMDSVIGQVSGIMDDAHKMIESAMSKLSASGSSSALPAAPGAKAIADAANQKAIDNLKSAKEHALSTGNFVPLLALTQPTLSLKSLPKEMVLPTSLPDLPTVPTIPGLGG